MTTACIKRVLPPRMSCVSFFLPASFLMVCFLAPGKAETLCVCVQQKRGKNLAICLLLRQPEAAKGCSQPVNSCPGTTQWLSMTSKATSLPKPQDIEQHSATCLSLTQPE